MNKMTRDPHAVSSSRYPMPPLRFDQNKRYRNGMAEYRMRIVKYNLDDGSVIEDGYCWVRPKKLGRKQVFDPLRKALGRPTGKAWSAAGMQVGWTFAKKEGDTTVGAKVWFPAGEVRDLMFYGTEDRNSYLERKYKARLKRELKKMNHGK